MLGYSSDTSLNISLTSVWTYKICHVDSSKMHSGSSQNISLDIPEPTRRTLQIFMPESSKNFCLDVTKTHVWMSANCSLNISKTAFWMFPKVYSEYFHTSSLHVPKINLKAIQYERKNLKNICTPIWSTSFHLTGPFICRERANRRSRGATEI